MRYKLLYMPDSQVEGIWYDTHDKALEAYNKIGSHGDNQPCEMCQAEWDIVPEDEINEEAE